MQGTMSESHVALADPMLEETPRSGRCSGKVLTLFAVALFGCAMLSGSIIAGQRASEPESINMAALRSMQTATSMQRAQFLQPFRSMSSMQYRFPPVTDEWMSEPRDVAGQSYGRARSGHYYSPYQMAQIEKNEKGLSGGSSYSAPAGGSSPSYQQAASSGGYTPEQLEFLKRREAESGGYSAPAPAAPAPAAAGGYTPEQLAFLKRREQERR